MIFFVLTTLSLQHAFSATQSHLEGGLRAETNAFYRDQNKVEDIAIYIKPGLSFDKKTGSTTTNFQLEADYSKYASNSTLDYLDYNANLSGSLNTSGKWVWQPSLHYSLKSEAPEDQGLERLEKIETLPALQLTYKKSTTKQHSLKVYGHQSTFNFDSLKYANNTKIGLTYQYQYYFLPETAFLLIGDVEQSIYQDGMMNVEALPTTTRYLSDNMLYQVQTGFSGRLTEHTTVNLLFGYAVRDYKKDSSYNEPVFEVGFHEQISPQDLLVAGYVYRINDSFYTNYELNQHMYLGYSRVFGDKYVVFVRSDYIYKSYSRPNRREDQRLTGTLRVDIAYKPKWLIQAGVNGDFLISDAVNQLPLTVVDRATSYQSMQFFVGSKFVF